MATGRMLNKSISVDAEFNSMPMLARLTFLLCLPHLDRDGCITGRLSQLWAMIDPHHVDTLDRIGECVNAWVHAGLAIAYDDGNQPAIFFKGFRKNNPSMKYEREARSQFGTPPGYTRTLKGLLLESQIPEETVAKSGVSPELVRTNSGLTPDKIKSSQVKSNDDDDDQSDHPLHHLGYSKGGVGGNAHLSTYDNRQLQLIALEFGSLIGLIEEWSGYLDYLSACDNDTLMRLIEWIAYYYDQPPERTSQIRSMTAVMRNHIKNGERASLRTLARNTMLAIAARSIELQVQPDEPESINY